MYVLLNIYLLREIRSDARITLPSSRVCVGIGRENTSMALSLVLEKHT